MFISLIRQLEAALLPDWGTGGLGPRLELRPRLGLGLGLGPRLRLRPRLGLRPRPRLGLRPRPRQGLRLRPRLGLRPRPRPRRLVLSHGLGLTHQGGVDLATLSAGEMSRPQYGAAPCAWAIWTWRRWSCHTLCRRR